MANQLRALVTGIAGFAGSHLADELLKGDYRVSGTVVPDGPTDNIEHIQAQLSLHEVDLRDPNAVKAFIAQVQPDHIYHLAARAAVGASFKNPAATLVDNAVMQLNILQAVVELGINPRILVIGSSDEYGSVKPNELPITEASPLRPMNPYAVSKITQDYMGYQYHVSHGLEIVRVRPFNHIGPRQGTGFVVPDFCSQIADIKIGLVPPVLRVGNLAAERDFSDVRDIVRAYRLALEKGNAGEVYNIGSGQSHSIQYILDTLLRLAGIPIAVEQDPARMRPSDTPRVQCDYSAFAHVTGWHPTITLEQSLADTLSGFEAHSKGKLG